MSLGKQTGQSLNLTAVQGTVLAKVEDLSLLIKQEWSKLEAGRAELNSKFSTTSDGKGDMRVAPWGSLGTRKPP